MQKIENVETEIGAALRQRILQRAEIGVTVFIRDRDLAVEQRGIARQLRQRPDQRLKPLGPVEAVAGADDDVAAGDRYNRAVAVVFYLVEPAFARRRRIDEGCELRRDEGREPCAGLFF